MPSGTITQTLRPSSGDGRELIAHEAADLLVLEHRAGPADPRRARGRDSGVAVCVMVPPACGPRNAEAGRLVHYTAMSDTGALALHPDRLLPAEPGVRAIARELYGAVRELPVISPHGHVDPRLLLEDEPFPDPATLLVTPDHYVTRLLHASGVTLDALGVAQGPLVGGAPRVRSGGACARTGTSSAARRCATGSSMSWWRSSASRAGRRPRSADAIYDELTARLAEPAFRPRALYDRFRIAVLATTDDPCDDLAAHAALAADPTLVRPRDPDLPARSLPRAGRPRLAGADGTAGARRPASDTGDYPGSCAAMEARRRHFIAHGATSADHSHEDVRTDALEPGRGRPHLPRRARRRGHAAPRRWRCAGTCCSRWRGCRARTAW